MVSETQLGEHIVGAYHKLITDCEIVSYNQRSKTDGEQTEIDVIGINSTNGEQVIYTCEVITHLHGTLYPGKPTTDRWEEFGNSDYQYTLEKLWKKFTSDHRYVTDVFDDADRYVFQLWSPVVPRGYVTDGLDQLTNDFENEYNHEIEMVINEDYTARVEELRELAANERKDYGEPAFRFLQILEHLR
ncbi:hypothetical protein RBH26_21145 [Natronolimnohabitans sp. A-GB9]|uniref:hypothetical protein n=1 Tax=Natronolimnohabitans sp. A-GB9 TaxID=3069757 RepID=UPI0027AFF4F5|nr:hypothetical protein [Natronolimnohabitans sp. A-GB9]MDQ2052952.1 hypothetical protein [Natronolimnohabitans sp. A-GB9]